jgi:hypothetical protein
MSCIGIAQSVKYSSAGYESRITYLVSLLAKCSGPVALEGVRNRPATLRAAQSHANQVTSLGGIRSIDKAVTTVKDCQVVDEVDVARVRLDLELRRTSDRFDCIEGFHLDRSWSR